MQSSPVQAKPSLPASSRGHRKRNQQTQRCKTYDYVRTLGEIAENYIEIEAGQRREICCEMKHHIGKCPQSKRPTVLDQYGYLENPSYGRHQQCQIQDPYRPRSETINKLFAGIWSQTGSGLNEFDPYVVEQQQERNRQKDANGPFCSSRTQPRKSWSRSRRTICLHSGTNSETRFLLVLALQIHSLIE